MNLFDKDKELILKLTNAALLVWFIGALVFTFSSGLDLVLEEPLREQTYDEYKSSCYVDDSLSVGEQEKNCESQYREYQYGQASRDFYKERDLYVAIANVVKVGTTMFILNKESTKKETPKKETKKKK